GPLPRPRARTALWARRGRGPAREGVVSDTGRPGTRLRARRPWAGGGTRGRRGLRSGGRTLGARLRGRRGGLGARCRSLAARLGRRGRRGRSGRRLGRRGPRVRARLRARCRGGLGTRLGCRTARRALRGGGIGSAVRRRVGFPEAPDDRGLEGGRRRLDELSLIAELRQKFFTGNTELFCQFVYPGLACHCSPHCEVSTAGWPGDLGLRSMDVHRWSFTVCSSCLVRSFAFSAPLTGPCGRRVVSSAGRSAPRTSVIASWDTVPATRNDLVKALRSSAVAMHRASRCTQAPRPSARLRGSGKRAPSSGSWTIRSSRESGSRRRQPTQVLTGPVTSASPTCWSRLSRIRPPRHLAALPHRRVSVQSL